MKRKSSPGVWGVTIIHCLPAITQLKQCIGKKNRINESRSDTANYFDLEFLQLHSVKCGLTVIFLQFSGANK